MLGALLKSETQRAFLAALLLASTVMMTIAPAAAQSAAATTLSGIVKSADGKALGDARITVTGTGFTKVIHSGNDGRFTVTVPPNTYAVDVVAKGFVDFHTDGVTVTSAQGATLNFALTPTSLETIGRTESNRKTAINTTSADTTVVSGQTFVDQGQPQVVNVLDQIPGVEINRASSNAPGANTSIEIRGAEPYESQILLDGHPLDTAGGSAYGFNSTFLNSLLLGGVEVSQGPGNMPLEIEDAVGGTVNFLTPKITGTPFVNGLAGFDSYNGQYYSFLASDSIGKFGFLAGIAAYNTPGYYTGTLLGGSVSRTISATTANDVLDGVVNYKYSASQAFSSNNQLVKLAYNFSPDTSITLENYSTQTLNNETGTLDTFYPESTIVSCINTSQKNVTTCPAGNKSNNYTSAPNVGLIGSAQLINDEAYPNDNEFDNEPIYSAEFRTTAGPGNFLARYYAGTVSRTIFQGSANVEGPPCTTVACPFGGFNDNGNAEPFIEDTLDVLHGVEGQYAIPFGADSVTFGFDRHTDNSIFGEFDPVTQTLDGTEKFVDITSIAYSLRGSFALTPKLTLESGNYFSDTSYVGHRFDPRDGLVYAVNPNASVRASWGTAFVAPYYSLLDQVGDSISKGDLTIPPTSFAPETSSSYDVGTDVKLNRDSLLSLDGYYSNIFNRYASVTAMVPAGMTFDGQNVSEITQEGNQANVREEGIEANFLYAPRVGFGVHSAVDLLRDYAFNQTATDVKVTSTFGGTPANGVQLPADPYSKFRNDLFYTFQSGLQFRLGATSYGANNSFGTPGFTLFDAAIRVPLRGLTFNIGGSNIFNHDDGAIGSIIDGGYTYPTVSGGLGAQYNYSTAPRTLFIQVQKALGPSGNLELPRNSL